MNFRRWAVLLFTLRLLLSASRAYAEGADFAGFGAGAFEGISVQASPGPAPLIDYPDGKIPGLSPKIESEDARKLLRYPLSFHQIVMQEEDGHLQSAVSPACLRKIRVYLREGGDFYLEKLRVDSVPVTEVKSHAYQSKWGIRFFHWTNAKILQAIAEAQDFHSIYSHLRNPHRRGKYYAWWLGSMFVASDPESSRDYGRRLVHVDMKDTARAAITDGSTGRKSSGYVDAWIKDGHGDFEVCRAGWRKIGFETYSSPLIHLIFEATGIDIVRYGEEGFHFITNPFAIQAMGAGE